MQIIKKAKFYILIEHRFLTGGTWIPNGSVERVQGVHGYHEKEAMYITQHILKVNLMVHGYVKTKYNSRGPPSLKG